MERRIHPLPGTLFAVLTGLLSAVPAAGGAPASRPASTMTRPSPAEAMLLEHVRTLASDRLRGRATGESGCREAADYIAREFRRIGLAPPPGEKDYLLTYTATLGSLLGPGNELSLPIGAGGRRAVELRTEFVPFAFSGTGRAEAEVVFAGYGISAPEYGYDDYAGVDIKGKVVLVLRHEPGQHDTASVFSGTRSTRHAEFRTKARLAEQQGAAGLIIVTDPLSREAEDDDLIPFGRGQGASAAVAIPVVHVKRRALDGFWGAGLEAPIPDLRSVQEEIDRTMKPRSFRVASGPVQLATEIVRERKETDNVVAWLPPTGVAPHATFDSAGTPEYVVVGAHYDHLGMGGESSLSPDTLAIHNGADDNASGTAALIEVARALAADTTPRSRGVLFAAFSGEELGLLGSNWLVNHPPLTIARNITMLNMDMVGRMKDNRLQVGGVGTSPRFRPLLESLAGETGVTLDYSEGGFGPSDHSSFYARNRPVLFFFTGLHEDYHRPSDDWEKLNLAGLATVTRLAGDLVGRLIRDSDPVPFVFAAADSARPVNEGGGGGYGPYLGTIPDFADYPNGVKLTGVKPGSPAELAGIKGGDVIVGFGGKVIRNLYDLTDELRAHKVGDVVTVELLRGEAKLSVSATLAKRK